MHAEGQYRFLKEDSSVSAAPFANPGQLSSGHLPCTVAFSAGVSVLDDGWLSRLRAGQADDQGSGYRDGYKLDRASLLLDLDSPIPAATLQTSR